MQRFEIGLGRRDLASESLVLLAGSHWHRPAISWLGACLQAFEGVTSAERVIFRAGIVVRKVHEGNYLETL